MSKYRAKKMVIDGMTFDSKKEGLRFLQLKELDRQGKIKNLRMQVEYELIPLQKEPDTVGPRGGVIRGRVYEHKVTYIADFVYEENGKTVVEDVKGMRTREYIIKRKLMLWRHGIKIREI